MRQFFLVILALVLVAAALIVANRRLDRPTPSGETLPAIILTNLPTGYCPVQAEIYHTSRLSGSIRQPVLTCNTIPLRTLGLAGTETIIVKLPRALAFAVYYSQDVQRYSVGVRVGDVTGDNTIDQHDEQLVLGNIFSDTTIGDADLNNRVDADDLALVRINQAVGVNRPDVEPWGLQ